MRNEGGGLWSRQPSCLGWEGPEQEESGLNPGERRDGNI